MKDHLFSVIKPLGNQSIRKFNRVELVENENRERFVLKSCSLENETGCQLLIEEFKFSFDVFGLPKVVELEKTDSELQLLLKYKEGLPLDQHWKKLKRKKRKAFLIQFIPAFLALLNEVHQKGIIHNDIRPGNILIQKDEIHLIDFGMATKKGEETKRKMLFSLQYAPPELILNRLHLLDETSDLFSFALVLIQLFNKEPVLTHSNPSVLTNLAIVYPIKLKGVVPKEFISLLEKMCTKAVFKTSPNRMKQDEADRLLNEAIKKRGIENIQVKWQKQLELWLNRKWWNL